MVVRPVALLQIKIDYLAERIFSHLSRPCESLEAADNGGRPRPIGACGKSDKDGSSFTGITALTWSFFLPGGLPTGPCTSLRDLSPRDADLRRVTAADRAALSLTCWIATEAAGMAADRAALSLTCWIAIAVASGHES